MNIEYRAIRLSFVYQKTVKETYAAMTRYASLLPCGWDQINWEGVDLNPYFLIKSQGGLTSKTSAIAPNSSPTSICLTSLQCLPSDDTDLHR